MWHFPATWTWKIKRQTFLMWNMLIAWCECNQHNFSHHMLSFQLVGYLHALKKLKVHVFPYKSLLEFIPNFQMAYITYRKASNPACFSRTNGAWYFGPTPSKNWVSNCLGSVTFNFQNLYHKITKIEF